MAFKNHSCNSFFIVYSHKEISGNIFKDYNYKIYLAYFFYLIVFQFDLSDNNSNEENLLKLLYISISFFFYKSHLEIFIKLLNMRYYFNNLMVLMFHKLYQKYIKISILKYQVKFLMISKKKIKIIKMVFFYFFLIKIIFLQKSLGYIKVSKNT